MVKNRLKIKELREERGLSQAELGKMLGFGQRTISHWENGTAQPQLEALIALSMFFDVSIDYLLGRTDDIFFKDTKISTKAQREIALINNFRKLNKDHQNRVLGYIDSMLKDADINFEISDDTFKNKLRELREEKGLTQKELGDILGYAQRTISGWESGLSEPNIDTLKKIAYFFNIDLNELLSFEDYSHNKTEYNYEQLLQEAKEQGIKDRELLMQKIHKERSG